MEEYLVTDAGEERAVRLSHEQPELKLAVWGRDAAFVLLSLEYEGQQE